MEHFRCTRRIATWRFARSARAMQDCNGDNRFRQTRQTRRGHASPATSRTEPLPCSTSRRLFGQLRCICRFYAHMHMCDIRRYRGVWALSHRTYPSGGGASHTTTRNDSPVKVGIRIVLALSWRAFAPWIGGAAMYPPPGGAPFPRHSHTSRRVPGMVPVRS